MTVREALTYLLKVLTGQGEPMDVFKVIKAVMVVINWILDQVSTEKRQAVMLAGDSVDRSDATLETMLRACMQYTGPDAESAPPGFLRELFDRLIAWIKELLAS